MRDLICGGGILSWVYVAAHSGTGQMISLFGFINASLEQVLHHIG